VQFCGAKEVTADLALDFDVDVSSCGGRIRQLQQQVQSRFLLNIVVRDCAGVIQPLSSTEEALARLTDSSLFFDFALDHVDGVAAFNLHFITVVVGICRSGDCSC